MEWIDVKNKTPKDFYLGYEPSPNVLVKHSWGISIGHMFESGAWFDDHSYDIEGVSHWMSLPANPKDFK